MEELYNLHELCGESYDRNVGLFGKLLANNAKDIGADRLDYALAAFVTQSYFFLIADNGIYEDFDHFDYDIESDRIYMVVKDGRKVDIPITRKTIVGMNPLQGFMLGSSHCLIKNYNPEVFKESVRSFNSDHFDKLMPSEEEDKTDAPHELSQEEIEYFKSLLQPDDEEGVHTSRHDAMPDAQMIAEDLFNLCLSSIIAEGITDVDHFECIWGGMSYDGCQDYCVWAALKNGKEPGLNITDLYNDNDEERRLEIEALREVNKRYKKRSSETLKEESKKFFNHETCLFRTDRNRRVETWNKVE